MCGTSSTWFCQRLSWFLQQYDGVEGFNIYGNERYIYQYISDKYPQEHIDFDISKIKLITLDIETTAEYGFPDVESAQEEILAITIQDYNTKRSPLGVWNLLLISRRM